MRHGGGFGERRCARDVHAGTGEELVREILCRGELDRDRIGERSALTEDMHRQAVAGELEQPRSQLSERRAQCGRRLRPHHAGESLPAGGERLLELTVGLPASEAVGGAEVAEERSTRPRKIELLRQARPRSHAAASVPGEF